ALNELDDILTVPGLDSLVVGPYDLSGSMGLLGQVTHPAVVEAIRTIITKTRKAGRYVGMGMPASLEHALQAAQMGVQWVQCGGDYSYMVSFVEQLFGQVRKSLAEPRR